MNNKNESVYFYTENKVTLSEQIKDDVDIELGTGVNIEKLTEGDKSPMFVTVEAMNEHVTGNKNQYDASVIEDVKNQILAKKPNMYQGHLSASDEGTKTPDPIVIWVGASTKVIDGTTRLFTKGYVLPTAKKLRTYLKKAVASGKDFPVSIYGRASVKYDAVKKANIVKKLVIQSIDWAREFNEGIQHKAGIMYLTSEMTSEFNLNEKEKMDYTNLTLKEIIDNKPEIIKEAVAEQTKVNETMIKEMTEVKDENVTLKEQIATYQKDNAHRVAAGIVDAKIKRQGVNTVVKTLVLSEMNNLKDLTNDSVEEHVKTILEMEEVQILLKEQKDPVTIGAVVNAKKATGTGLTTRK